jgi:hypothetical protein
MRDYQIEFDVRLWTYVLHYRGEKYTLNVDCVTQAYERSKLKLIQLQREHEQESSNDSFV